MGTYRPSYDVDLVRNFASVKWRRFGEDRKHKLTTVNNLVDCFSKEQLRTTGHG